MTAQSPSAAAEESSMAIKELKDRQGTDSTMTMAVFKVDHEEHQDGVRWRRAV